MNTKQYENNWRNFKLIIEEDEMTRIKKWVLMKPNIETGGDLFGLWVDRHTAVVQLVLGPGEHCRRTSVSFHQDINYLQEKGEYLIVNHGLCNIGQWHSHHCMHLPYPSGGDENTVWNNMPSLGLQRYIVFICNTNASYYGIPDEVQINCFLFEMNKHGSPSPVLKGSFEILKNNQSPFRNNLELMQFIEEGEEKDMKKRKFQNNNEEVKFDLCPLLTATSKNEKIFLSTKKKLKMTFCLKDSDLMLSHMSCN